jgi:hypothetical protein
MRRICFLLGLVLVACGGSSSSHWWKPDMSAPQHGLCKGGLVQVTYNVDSSAVSAYIAAVTPGIHRVVEPLLEMDNIESGLSDMPLRNKAGDLGLTSCVLPPNWLQVLATPTSNWGQTTCSVVVNGHLEVQRQTATNGAKVECDYYLTNDPG